MAQSEKKAACCLHLHSLHHSWRLDDYKSHGMQGLRSCHGLSYSGGDHVSQDASTLFGPKMYSYMRLAM